MEPVGVSGAVTISDQRSYIKIEILLGKNPTEVHGASTEVYREFTVDRSKVFRWDSSFRVVLWAQTMIQEEEGREHQQTKEVWSLWDDLEEERPATCEERSRATGAKTSQENAQERPQLLVAGSLIVNENARHISGML